MHTLAIQVQTDLKRTLLRNISFIFFTLAMPVGFYLLFTKVFNMGVPSEYLSVFYKDSMMQMTFYSVMISSMFSFSLTLIEDRKQGIKQLLRLSPLPESMYYGSKIITQFFVNTLLILVIFALGHFVNGVTMSPLEWLTSGCWLLFGSLPIIALATIVGLLKSVSTASAVNNMILMPLAILSGLWWPIENFPKLLQHFAQWLPTYHAAEGAKQLAAGELPTAKGSLIIFGSFLGIMVLSIYLNKQKEEVLR